MGERAPIWALGLMSGTSMDGIDGAAILTDGVEILGFGPKRFEPYPPEMKARLVAAQGQWPAEVDAALVGDLDAAHAELALFFPTTELIGYHGQTLAHDPAGFRTHQAGDGARLADATGQPVVWDFRSADVLSGGEGAPLVPFFHHACARMAGLDQTVAFLNIGGVANVTWVDPLSPTPEEPGALLAFDTGPGNALINDLVRSRHGLEMDEGGRLAAAGAVDEALVREVLGDAHFSRPAPKSLDRNHFAWVLDRVADKDDADALATLTAITAAGVAEALRHMPEPPGRWLICGGGRHNQTLMRMIGTRGNAPVAPVEEIGLDGDFLEAQAFGYLAARVLHGLPTSGPATTGARLPVCGGRISQPGAAAQGRFKVRAL